MRKYIDKKEKEGGTQITKGFSALSPPTASAEFMLPSNQHQHCIDICLSIKSASAPASAQDVLNSIGLQYNWLYFEHNVWSFWHGHPSVAKYAGYLRICRSKDLTKIHNWVVIKWILKNEQKIKGLGGLNSWFNFVLTCCNFCDRWLWPYWTLDPFWFASKSYADLIWIYWQKTLAL